MYLFQLNDNTSPVDAVTGGIVDHIAPTSRGAIKISSVQSDGVYVVWFRHNADATPFIAWLNHYSAPYVMHEVTVEDFAEKLASLLRQFAQRFGVEPYGVQTPERQDALSLLVNHAFAGQL